VGGSVRRHFGEDEEEDETAFQTSVHDCEQVGPWNDLQHFLALESINRVENAG
jgi:hypothetical protein